MAVTCGEAVPLICMPTYHSWTGVWFLPQLPLRISKDDWWERVLSHFWADQGLYHILLESLQNQENDRLGSLTENGNFQTQSSSKPLALVTLLFLSSIDYGLLYAKHCYQY
jgi:hypothetical protein